MKRSAIYEGEVEHHRLGPKPHAFRRRLFLMYLDLDQSQRPRNSRGSSSRSRYMRNRR